jgi:hypothetical protein
MHMPVYPHPVFASSQRAHQLLTASGSVAAADVGHSGGEEEVGYGVGLPDARREGGGLPLTASQRDKWMR